MNAAAERTHEVSAYEYDLGRIALSYACGMISLSSMGEMIAASRDRRRGLLDERALEGLLNRAARGEPVSEILMHWRVTNGLRV